ncbi:hypothetical protein TNCV_2932461 [Trichonephila clavipes]|nr:hypothetical protein TNCV_2932461 [Trichonephila clavipes]
MRYPDILADPVHPANDGDEYFVNDNANIHHARSAQNWIVELQSDIQHLPCPPNNPDLNPIENVWDGGRRHIRQHSYFHSIYKI